jgi:hypothetical protein
MKYLKLFEEYRGDFNQEYHLDDFYFKVSNGGPSEGTEIGDISVNFDKEGEEVICEFEVYQPASGDWGVICEDETTASELGIKLDDRGKVLDDDLVGELLDAYGSGGGEGEWNDMTFVVEDVNPRGVIEEGWLLITIYKDGKEEEVQFEIRQEAFGVGRMDLVEIDSDDDLEKLKELGIEFNDDFKDELAVAYDDYSNFIRP